MPDGDDPKPKRNQCPRCHRHTFKLVLVDGRPCRYCTHCGNDSGATELTPLPQTFIRFNMGKRPKGENVDVLYGNLS